jgi:hypothetical protein
MANKIYVNRETAITFADSAQTPTVSITLANLATVTGRYSPQHDRGASAHAAMYKWRFTSQLTGTNVVGAEIELYLITANGTGVANIDGGLGTTDAALATDKRRNLKYIGSLVVDQTTTNTTMTASGYVFIPSRYISLGVWNATTLSMRNDTSVHTFTLTPAPWEVQ